MLIKKIITAGILFVILATSVAPVGIRAQPVGNISPQNPQGNTSSSNGPVAAISGVAEAAMYNFVTEKIAGFIGWTLQRISGLVLLISGLLFDRVVDETVVKMSDHLGSKSGIGMSVNSAWVTLRDIANMVFIFVLLYTAFNAMFTSGVGNVGRNIAWIIIIALVINFSLFFSKVVIDASNVVSLGFYKAIANTGSYELTLENGSTTETTKTEFNGISAGYMRMLGIHSFWSFDTNTENIHGAQNVLIMGILTAVFVLIASVILLITSIMFVSRFVILIFIMILSPVAFVMYIIPGMSGKFSEWWKALVNQAFFAPVFFALTWVVFKVGSTMSTLSNTTQNGVNWTQIVSAPSAMMGLVINYFIIIGLSIFALTTAKKMASSVAGFTAVSTALGTAAIGTTAVLGRNTVGRGAKWLAENKRDDWEKSKGGRAGLWLANKTAERSFDIRAVGGTGVGKAMGLDKVLGDLGKAGGKGGFSKAIEEKAERKAKYGKQTYGQTVEETRKANELQGPYLEAKAAEEARIKDERRKAIEKIEKEREEYMNNKTNKASLENLEKDRERMTNELSEIQKNKGKDSTEYKQKYSDIENIANKIGAEKERVRESRITIEQNPEYKEFEKRIEEARRKVKETEGKDKNWIDKVKKEEKDEEFSRKEEEYLRYKDAGKRRLKNYAQRLRNKFGAGNQAAAKKVEDIAEGKDKKKPEQILKDFRETFGIEDEKKPAEETTDENKNKTP